MEVWSRSQVTAIMVTHDVDEAILLADRVVMMTNGPRARIGRVMNVPLPRPRTREALLAAPALLRAARGADRLPRGLRAPALTPRRHEELHPRRRGLAVRTPPTRCWNSAAAASAARSASRQSSRSMCFGRGEGLPGTRLGRGPAGRAEAVRGLVLPAHRGAPHAEGLTCGIALPVFAGDELRARDGDLLRRRRAARRRDRGVAQPAEPSRPDMALDDGYYGTTVGSVRVRLAPDELPPRLGPARHGLGGRACRCSCPTCAKARASCDPTAPSRSASTAASPMPCSTRRTGTSGCSPSSRRWPRRSRAASRPGSATPRVRHLRRLEGFCETDGVLGASADGRAHRTRRGPLGAALASGVPAVAEAAADEPGTPAAVARASASARSPRCLSSAATGVRAVAVWYFRRTMQ